MSDITTTPGPNRASAFKQRVYGGSRNAFGLVCGNAERFWLTEIVVAGLLRIASPGGKKGPPYIYTLPAYTQLGTAMIDMASADPIRFDVIPGVDYCEIRKISFSNWTAQPPSDFRGGIYAAPPAANGTPASGSVILSNQTSYNEVAPGEFSTVLKDVPPEIHRPHAFYWVPGVKSSIPLQATISIEGMAFFKQNGVIVPP